MEAYPTPGAIVSGRYRIDALLGEGGMGAVFRATELSSNLGVALKFPSPEMRVRPGMASRFANEATAASRIACEHVVQIYGVETTEGGTPFIVMELLAGRDLDAIVEHEAPLPPARAVHFTLQVLRALQVAHAAGVVHRDLKPSNALVVSRDGDPDYVKLIDFGITKILGDDKGLTKTSTTLGTPAYMAPEQAKSAKAADSRSDLYSVGVILYELLTRRQPFEGESQNEIVIKICTEPPMPIRNVRPDLPAGLASAVEHALVKAPLGRFPTAEAFAAALEPFADERSRAVLARIHAGVSQPASAGVLALAPTPMADAPPAPPPRAPSGTAMMDESLLPADLRAGLAAAPAPGHVIITPPGMEALAREPAGKTVVGEVSFGGAPAAGPSLVSAASPAVVTPPPAVPYVPGPPASDYEERGGGRGPLLAILGVLAVALIGGGIYLAVRSPGGGGSTPSAGPGKSNVDLSDDDNSSEPSKKKKKKPADDQAASDTTDTAAATDTNAPKPTYAPPPVRPTTTTTATALPSASAKPSGSLPVPTSTVPTAFPTTTSPTIVFPSTWPPRPTSAPPPTTTTTAPTGTTTPTVAPQPTVPGKPRPRFGGG